MDHIDISPLPNAFTDIFLEVYNNELLPSTSESNILNIPECIFQIHTVCLACCRVQVVSIMYDDAKVRLFRLIELSLLKITVSYEYLMCNLAGTDTVNYVTGMWHKEVVHVISICGFFNVHVTFTCPFTWRVDVSWHLGCNWDQVPHL